MSQLSGLNHTQHTQSSQANGELKAKKADLIPTQVKVGDNFQAQFKFAGSATSLTQQLTMAQSNALQSQPLLSLMTQQTALVFLRSQAGIQQLALPAELQHLAQQWLKSDKPLNQLPPPALAKFIGIKLGLNQREMSTQLTAVTLNQAMLQLNFLQGDPITELKLNGTISQSALEQLEQVLQFMLPIQAQDDASLLIQEQKQSGAEQDEGQLQFKLNFDLDALGKLQVQIRLKGFELSAECLCDSTILQQKVERHWPLLSERLDKMGFAVSAQIKKKTRLDAAVPSPQTSTSINIKV